MRCMNVHASVLLGAQEKRVPRFLILEALINVVICKAFFMRKLFVIEHLRSILNHLEVSKELSSPPPPIKW